MKVLALPFDIMAQKNPSIQHANASAQFFYGGVRCLAVVFIFWNEREERINGMFRPGKR